MYLNTYTTFPNKLDRSEKKGKDRWNTQLFLNIIWSQAYWTFQYLKNIFKESRGKENYIAKSNLIFNPQEKRKHGRHK